jgi:hypothetical protein
MFELLGVGTVSSCQEVFVGYQCGTALMLPGIALIKES